MKLKKNLKKVTEAIADVSNKTTEASKKISSSVHQKAKDISEKTKNDNYQRRLKKYNPVFPEVFNSEDFHIPNMIIIVDDAVRRGVDVCEGSIGWLSNETGMEVLHLYDEAVAESGVQFVPAPICDTVYYVDKFDHNRFIQTDCIFSKAHEERLAELKNIAYSLGAKKCTIEISESNIELEVSKKKAKTKNGAQIYGVSGTSEASAEQSSSYKGKSERKGKIVAEFEGNDVAKRPALKWFEHDDTIKNLIEIKCEGNNQLKSETLVLEGAVSATMSKKTAYTIDNALGKLGSSGSTNMEGQAVKENHTKLIFNIEF